MIDAVVMGRVGIDLYPNELRTPLREVSTFTRYVGGFAGNVSTGLARLNMRTAIVSRVGDDGNGLFVRDFLEREGIDTRFLAVDEYWPTPPTFCEIWPPDHFPLTFYRRPTAPDWQLQPNDFDAGEVAAAPLLLATGTGLAQSPSRETTRDALAAHRGTTVFDLDWRPTLWTEPSEYRELAQEAAALADVVIGNTDEIAAAGGHDELLALVPALIVKRGEHGATLHENGEVVDVPGLPVDVLNGLGAGDAFAAAVGYAITRDLGLHEGLRLGNIAGAHVARQVPCANAMPTLDDLVRVEVP